MTDRDALALCLWREARGEKEQGMLAVGCVIMNRVKDQKISLQKAIFGKNQFTSMSVPTDPEYNLMPPKGDKLYAVAFDIADDLISGDYEDITKHALFYANLKYIDAGGWFERNIVNKPHMHPETVTLGNHTFFS
jgi:hypothetical protein